MKTYNAYDIYNIMKEYFCFRLGDDEELKRSDLEQEIDKLLKEIKRKENNFDDRK